jgi:hypothetical protein
MSFSSTIKLLKQTVKIELSETDFDDIEEEDESEKKENEEDVKLISRFESLSYFYFSQSKAGLNPIEAKLVSMLKNIQSPPPKI